MNKYIINYNEDKQIWDVFVSLSPQRSIFAYTVFLDSLNTKYDLVTCSENNRIVAGAILIYSEINKPINGVFPFTQYQGILLAGNTNQNIHSQVTSEFKIEEFFIGELVRHYDSCCFCNSWRLNDLRPFQWFNYNEPDKGQFKIQLNYTGILDLKKYSSFEDYLGSVRSVRRQEYKKSLKNLKIVFETDENILDVLHAMTFDRQNIERTNHDSFLVRSICKHAVDFGYGKLGVAILDDLPVSAVLFLYDDRTAYYLFGANDPAYRNTGSGTFLMMHMIQDAFDMNLFEVDFVGVNSPNRGDFKISFNAELRPYFITKMIS